MIALTQEKRQKRIDWLKDRISSMEQCRDEIPFGLSEDESMELSAYKDSLASLAAEPVGYTWDRGINCELLAVEINDEVPIGATLFTAPPVPEIKLPDDNLCEDGLKKHGLRTKEEGISQLSDGFRCGFAWYEHEIKRLNGLVE